MLGRREFIAAAIAGSISAAPAISWALTADQLSEIDREAADYIKAGKAAGLAIGIAVKGEPVLVRSYGLADLELGVPVTTKSVFRAGSLTKQFTAAGILILAEHGKLQTTDKLSKYFPDFPRADEITLADLLHHISGIHNYTESHDFLMMSRQTWPTLKLVDYIKAQPKPYDFDPGTMWHYSNSNYVLLGAIIEKVSGETLPAFMKENLFQPQGMTSSAYDQDDEIVPGRSHGYHLAKDHGFVIPPFMSVTSAGGAGMLRTTVGDLLIWEQALFGGKVVSPEHFVEMTTPARLRSGELASAHVFTPPGRKPPTGSQADYGYGIAIFRNEGGLDLFHNGDIFGYSSRVDHFVDSDISVIVLTNTLYAANDLAVQIRQVISKK
jgi:CubicO group peptidase (beta-lactamase class C family)